MYNEEGEEVWSGALDIYGRTTKETGTQGFCPFRYQGQYFDEEINLCYNRFRYYDPESGNYISQDPIGLEGNNPTLYGYVKDSNTWIDIFGLAGLYDIHSVTQPDIVTKGLHFYGKNNVELAVRPNSNGGISFKSPFSTKNLSKSEKLNLQSAIKDAEKKFASDASWRKSIMDNAASGKKVLVESFGDDALGAMARGRSAELNFIERNIKKMCN